MLTPKVITKEEKGDERWMPDPMSGMLLDAGQACGSAHLSRWRHRGCVY
jgi:hypothetical protein